MFTFNETRLYKTINVFYSFRIWLNKLKIPGALFYGQYGYPLAPDHTQELRTVIGEPIIVE